MHSLFALIFMHDSIIHMSTAVVAQIRRNDACCIDVLHKVIAVFSLPHRLPPALDY